MNLVKMAVLAVVLAATGCMEAAGGEGDAGVQGVPGPPGPAGPQGPQGPKGDTGSTAPVLVYVDAAGRLVGPHPSPCLDAEGNYWQLNAEEAKCYPYPAQTFFETSDCTGTEYTYVIAPRMVFTAGRDGRTRVRPDNQRSKLVDVRSQFVPPDSCSGNQPSTILAIDMPPARDLTPLATGLFPPLHLEVR